MAAPYWFFGYDSLMEFVACGIAMAIAYEAMKGYALVKQRILLYLNLSFILLGAGLLVDGLSNVVIVFARFHRELLFLYTIGYTINFVAQLIAYGILVFAYFQQTRAFATQITMAAVIPIMFMQRNSFSELILVFLLVYISAQTAINYSVSKGTNAFLVLSAFSCLTLAHVLFLLFTIIPILFPFAQIAQLFGFLLLLAMLFRVNQAL
ncbi:MAG TPA: hypothetical protein VEH56_03230 [Candidatus Saccharimonadales bacterium]|nr:hypothetical protein [Candidatus Saccharimonadales bacterium]